MNSIANPLRIDCTGYHVDADWYAGETDENIMLVLPGWGSDRKRYGEILPYLVNASGMSALVLEYSGHGESPIDIDQTRPAQHFLEVIYAFDKLSMDHPTAEITLFGSSYGGYMATQLTKYRKFANLILRAPAIYRPEDFYTLNSEIMGEANWDTTFSFRQDKEALAKHPLLARASNFAGNSLVIVHSEDTVIPKETTDAYITAFGADTYVAEGFGHSTRDLPQEMIEAELDAMGNWLRSRARTA